MDKQSYLDAQQLKNVCDNYLVLYKRDNDTRTLMCQQIDRAITILSSVCCGEAIEAFSQFIKTSLTPIVEAAQAANECDIRDIKILKSKLNKTYDGNFICTSYEKANRNRDLYISKAETEKSRAASFNTTVTKILPNGTIITEHISNPHEALAKTYQSMADGYQEEMNMWQGEMNEFDAIESATAGLFSDGLAIRKEKLGVDVHQQFTEQLETNLKLLGISSALAISLKDAIAGLFKFTLFKGKNPDGVTVTNPGWLVDNAEKYGLTEMEARYIEEYHPTLANSLYGLSQTDHQGYIDLTVKDIKTKLRDEYFYMMEEYGYSYEAISYLHENNPSLMAALDSHYGPASIPDARMNIYNYLHERDICIYAPNRDLDAYNMEPDYINSIKPKDQLQYHTNCYAFAFGLTEDPRTGERFPGHGLQPGYFSGQTYNRDVVYSSSDQGKTLVGIIQDDAEVLDLNFEQYEPGMTGGVRVVLVIDPNDDGDGDYHWYYYDENTGKWYNKQGVTEATGNYIDWDSRQPYDGVLEDNQGVYYSDYYGGLLEYNYGEEIGSTYEDVIRHAQSEGYTIVAGDQDKEGFYITRQDGGEFY